MIEVKSELPVVSLPEAEDEAYIMGRTEFDGQETTATDIANYKDSSRYCNTINNRIESLAGENYDTEYVVVVEEPHNQPAKGYIMRCTELVHELDNEFTQGALDSND